MKLKLNKRHQSKIEISLILKENLKQTKTKDYYHCDRGLYTLIYVTTIEMKFF